MASHVALLRGINVGGRNKVPMAELREVVASLGHAGVATYIQSGNVLFSTEETDNAKLAAALESAIEDRFGLWSSVVVLSRDELAEVLAANPYPDEPDPRLVHVVFLNADPPPDLSDRITAVVGAAAAKGSRDTVQASGRALYVHTPDGFGRSEVAQNLFKLVTPPAEAKEAGRLASQGEKAEPGRHGQELGHGDQAAVAVRGEVVARAVLVTGASRGIGRAVAQAFAELGDRVAVHHRGSPGLADEVLAGLPGRGHLVVQADLADAGAVRQMVDRAQAGLGGLDVLVNNAGIYVPHPVTEVSYEQWQDTWREVLAVNLTGAANVTWCAVQYMKATGGRIVNVTSRGAYRGEPRHPAYGASKAGLNSFGQSMARALAPFGIAVASVAPGFVETAMARPDLDSARGEEIRAQSPFHRVATTAEIAAAVVYLASEQAEWASGAVLDLNGASYLR